ncbi:ATP-dependent DNA ligase [Nocardia fluminea]
MHVQRPAPALIDQVRVDYLVFDLLAVDDQVLLEDPYRTRRAELADLTLDDGERVRGPPMWSLTETGAEELLRVAADSGLEGIVCKRGDSVYEPGRRSSAWTKVVLRLTTEAVIVGAVPGNGANATTFGGLVLAGHTPDGRLRCIGGVGTGFTAASRRNIRAALDRVRRETSRSTTHRRRRSRGPRGGSSRCSSPTSSTARSAATACCGTPVSGGSVPTRHPTRSACPARAKFGRTACARHCSP